jgi:hypothetical protein
MEEAAPPVQRRQARPAPPPANCWPAFSLAFLQPDSGMPGKFPGHHFIPSAEAFIMTRPLPRTPAARPCAPIGSPYDGRRPGGPVSASPRHEALGQIAFCQEKQHFMDTISRKWPVVHLDR